MKCRLFNIFAALSLLLCVATVTLWVRSYHRQSWVRWMRTGSSSRCYAMSLGSFPGRLSIDVEWQAGDDKPLWQGDFSRVPMWFQPGFTSWSGPTPPRNASYDPYAMTLPQRPDLYQFAGLAWYADHSYTNSWNLLVPHRYIVLIAMALPLRWLWLRYQTVRRAGRNECIVCGYDLRATPDRCPECGAVAAEAPNAPRVN